FCALVGKEQCERHEKNADAEVQNLQRVVERGVDHIFKKGDDQNHQDDFRQPVLEIVQTVNQEYPGTCRRFRLGLIDLADEQFVQSQGEDEQDSCEQKVVHGADDVSHDFAVKLLIHGASP